MGLCSPSLCALAAPWLGCGTAPAAPAPGAAALGLCSAGFGTGLPRLEVLRHHPPSPWHEVPSHGWEKIPVQEPARGPITKPQPGFMMSTGSARARLTPSGITGGSGGHMQGEAPKVQGLRMPQHHQREHTGAALPSAHSALLHSQHPLPKGSASTGTRQTPECCTSPGLALPPCCALSTELTPAAKPPVPAPALQTPEPHPANIPPARSNATTGPQPRPQPDPSHGHAGQEAATDPQTASPSLGELGREPSWPLDHQPLPLARETPAGPSLRPHARGHARGTGREIKIPSARVVPVLSAQRTQRNLNTGHKAISRRQLTGINCVTH